MKIRLVLLLLLAIITSSDIHSQIFMKFENGKSAFVNVKYENDKEYRIEQEDRIISIPKDKVILIETEEEGVIIFKEDKISCIKDWDMTEGPLFKKGNMIYIPYSSTKIVTRVGSRYLREYLMRDGFWNIVSCVDEAHCIFEYVFDDTGRDSAYIRIKTRNGDILYESEKVSAKDFIPHHAGEESATRLYNRIIPKIKKLVTE